MSGRLSGRTLYCSLPLCRILSKEELTSIIGHELGHFKGEDTKFSIRFYPIYRGTTSSLAALHEAAGEDAGSISLLPALAVFSYFLDCFSVAESRLSRERELAADLAGSSISSPQTLAAALVKLHAFSGLWEQLEESAAAGLRQGKAFVNASKIYADGAQKIATPEVLKGLADARLSHPTDSHPLLPERLQSLTVELEDIASAALAVTPADSAITLITDAEALEEEISEIYQMLLARQLGIDIETTSDAEGDE